jgi:ribosomal protein L3 glutamine methyltransferase
MTTFKTYLDKTTHAFESADLYYGHGTTSAHDEAVAVLLHVLQLPPDTDNSILTRELNDAQISAVEALSQQRIATQKPLAYLTGYTYFCGLKFFVSEDTIVPRSPIGELIEAQYAPWINPENTTHILDMCTGSGCMAIATALAMPWVHVDAVDISPEALAIAQKNVALYELQDRVTLIESDGFTALKGKQYDLIVSNPPYVDARDMKAMPAEYHHEPEISLASGEDGLNFTREFLSQAPAHLTEGGSMIVEVGNSAPALEAAYPDVPFMWVEFERGGDGVFFLEKLSC